MPVTIPPGEARAIAVATKLPKQAGLFTRKVELLVDDDGVRRVTFRVTGRIKNVAADSSVAERGR